MMEEKFRKHALAACREILLAMRILIDTAIERAEKPEVELIPDDFIAISGIGPKIQTLLNQAGVLTYAQLAQLTPEEIAEITKRSAARISQEGWIAQARALAGEE